MVIFCRLLLFTAAVWIDTNLVIEMANKQQQKV